MTWQKIVYMSFVLIICSCKKEPISANDIISQTVEAYGGIAHWNNIQQLSFDKEVTLFLEDHTIERKTNQFQLFQFEDAFGKIEWDENGIEHQIVYENNNFSKVENDSAITSPEARAYAERAFFASEYVIKQPFDLLRDEVRLVRETDTIVNSKDCYVVSVHYEDEAPDADRWYYIVSKLDNLIVANKVVLKDHTSWVENLTYDTTTDFIFNAHRKSYRLNSAGEKTYLRAEYFYSNYSVLY